MKEYIGIEEVFHGRRWSALHDGYFSDPSIARPLLETVKGILAKSPADVVVDFGGGTGFLLSQLKLQGVGADTAMVNVDCSEAQLSLSEEEGIPSVCALIDSFKRGDVTSRDSRVFFMMRSVLHYFGKDGSLPLLCHLRKQAKPGEFFVHQTASFEHEKEAACLNALYRYMHTHKWYPTVTDLRSRMTDAGWRVLDTIPAPSLRLTSDDLGRRYALDSSIIARIRDIMASEFGDISGVFRLMPSGFQANMHYRIYSCVAVAS